MKKTISIILIISILFCLSACSNDISNDSSESTQKAKYVVYKSIGFPKTAYIFEKDFKKQNKGNYKTIFIHELEALKDKAVSYSDIESDNSGTYVWHKENQNLTLTPNDYDYSSDLFLLDDYLIPSSLFDFAGSYKKQGEYITGSCEFMYNLWNFYSDGNYSFSYKSDYSGGLYYIKDNFIYTKSNGEEEYTVQAMLVDDKLLVFDLGTIVYKLEK